MMKRTFCIQDEKFEMIANELIRRGWESVSSDKHAALTWTNLVRAIGALAVVIQVSIALYSNIRRKFDLGES